MKDDCTDIKIICSTIVSVLFLVICVCILSEKETNKCRELLKDKPGAEIAVACGVHQIK